MHMHEEPNRSTGGGIAQDEDRMVTSCLAKKVPELVRTWLMTLFPESLSATIDFSMLPFAFKPQQKRKKGKLCCERLRTNGT